MILQREQIELFINRCVELTSKETTPGVIVPLAASQNIAAFLLDALKGAYAYAGVDVSLLPDAISKPTDLLHCLTSTGPRRLNNEFQMVIEYVKNHLSEFNPTEIEANLICSSYDEVINLAERFTRHLISVGFHPSYLNDYFSATHLPSELSGRASDLRGAIDELLAYFQSRIEPHSYSIYTPILIGKGGEDWGFKSVLWNKLSESVQKAFSKYLSQELNIIPGETNKPHDEGYQGRYQKWELEYGTLALSKYLKVDVKSCDPFSAAEEFREKYNLMKHVVYISRKSTGTSSGKSIHNTHRNTGRSPVQLQDISVIIGTQDYANERATLVYLDKPSFPYQKLKNEFARQRELIELFYNKCAVFRQLAKSYSNALEAFSNRDVEDIFRNLAVATELAFAKDNFSENKAQKLLLNEGAKLLALDWLRDQFQSLTFLAKKHSPGKSEEKDDIQIHLNIIDDKNWDAFSTKIRIPALLMWRRERLMYIFNNSGTELDNLRDRFKAELTILWHARHQFAHRANVFREGYFVSLLLNLFRIALDYRFSCYAIWLEYSGPQFPDNSLRW